MIRMVEFILSFAAVICFCVCAHQFVKVIVTPLPRLNLSEFNRSALKVKRVYSIFSWGVMTGTFLIALVVSFVQVYGQL